MTDRFDAAMEKLRQLERESPPGGWGPRPREEVARICEEVLTLSRMRGNGAGRGDVWEWRRNGGKTGSLHVPAPEEEPRATWRLRRRMMRCGKAGCTKCPHGPYLYVRITAPEGAVSDVSLGRAPAARHVFDRLGDRLDGEQVSEIVRAIREEGR